MAVEHTNRVKKTYYLRQGKTKTGKPRYFFSAKETGKGDPVESIPEGYEIFESPVNAMPFLRKIVPQLMTDLEKKIIAKALKLNRSSKRYLVDYNRKQITIYESSSNVGLFEGFNERFLKDFPDLSEANSKQALKDICAASDQHYSAMLRFTLVDEKRRRFIAERFCFLGSIDDWVYIDGEQSLKTHSEKHIPLLGTDAFFQV